MNNEFIPYEQNLEIRNLGFDEPCIGFYNIDLDVIPIDSEPYTTKSKDGAILYQQAFRWFREKYGITVFIDYTYLDGMQFGFKWVKLNGDFGEDWNEVLNTYEEAELACLKKLIEVVKTK
jgi:hypothetical protein